MTRTTTPKQTLQLTANTHHPATLAIYVSLPPDPISRAERKRWPRVYVTHGFQVVEQGAASS